MNHAISRFSRLIALAFATAAVASSVAAADVGVSISIGQPGFYGNIVIGNAPPPQVIYPKPVIIQRPPAGVVRQPLYLRVPPGHEKKWNKHCHKYKACGQPVYFVQEGWYHENYARQQGHDERRDDNGHGHDKGHDQGHGKKNKGRGD